MVAAGRLTRLDIVGIFAVLDSGERLALANVWQVARDMPYCNGDDSEISDLRLPAADQE